MAKRKKKSEPAPAAQAVQQVMVVNDVPGEECRIALLENGKLEELYSERTANVTAVGNIYKGRVINVEPAIQAAFIDFGASQNGFLHISDLHPRYFGGDGEKTERVGKKTPRRDRPPIQQALRRGQSILVQVIKEGIGTKGPTLTSYLSIPGRLMVMMPGMDRIGVSRKIEDEEKRREMRQILDSLDLPDDVGFILRTAGFGRTKTELKRDLAYLNRLWKTMKKRIDTVQAPCPLYVESDLLIRTIRDVLTTNVSAIVVDSQSGYNRAREFLSVIAPRSAPKIVRYRRTTPIFHAFDIERQIDLIHQREVALPSGGAIVIEQTEALVAIDVNSGKSRGARDAETNAYQTNCEAVDEICRQLRLRDLGGLVVNDLIDMVKNENRRAIEKRFRDNLARDRAKTTVTRISEFGVLEMTRQRMRPSLRKAHFTPCPTCQGRGEVRSAESLASESIRFAAYLLQFDRVRTVEIVCSPRLASTFLSGRRRTLVRLEESFGKRVHIRVSDTMTGDRTDYYAYDERNADIDISALPALTPPKIEELERDAEPRAAETRAAGDEVPTKSKRRRRRRKKAATPEAAMRGAELDADEPTEERAKQEAKPAAQKVMEEQAKTQAASASANGESPGEPRRRKRRRRRRSKRSAEARTETRATEEQTSPKPDSEGPSGALESDATSDAASDATEGAPEPKRKRRRRRRRRRGGGRSEQLQPTPTEHDGQRGPSREGPAPAPPAPEVKDEKPQQQVKPRRALYRSRRKLASGSAKSAREKSDE